MSTDKNAFQSAMRSLHSSAPTTVTFAKSLNRRRRLKPRAHWIVPLLVPGLVCCSLSFARQRAKNRAATTYTTNGAATGGRQKFEAHCSNCHGLDGRGGEHAPNVATNPAVQGLTDSDIARIIHTGIRAKGMPGFEHLSDADTKSIVGYLRVLGGAIHSVISGGNPRRGEDLFFGKAGCGACHMMTGTGGFLGSDLTAYGKTHEPEELRSFLLSPAQGGESKLVEIVTRQGERLSGAVRNEDNFSLQLLGSDGRFHMLMKSEIEKLDRNESDVVHSERAQRLAAAELEDLIMYLNQPEAASAPGVPEPPH